MMKGQFFRRLWQGLFRFLTLAFGMLMLLFGNSQQVYPASYPSDVVSDEKVFEFLRIHVPEDYREAWLKAEKSSWEPWLMNKSGFLGRQLYWDPESEEGVLLIGWATREQWKAIPQDEVDAIQERFERLARKVTGKRYGNPFPLQYEGELMPQ